MKGTKRDKPPRERLTERELCQRAHTGQLLDCDFDTLFAEDFLPEPNELDES